ncbi:MAG: peptidase C39 family protein [Thermoplasmata archaeon]
MRGSDEPSHWRQTFPLSCGAVAPGSALTAFGWTDTKDRLRKEDEIWRRSTAVAGPGAHPFGLALSARRKGSRQSWRWKEVVRGCGTM